MMPARPTALLLALLVPTLAANAHQDQIRSPSPRLPRDANVFIDPIDGFGSELERAFLKESVPLVLVSSKEDADFEITGSIRDIVDDESTGAIDVSARDAGQKVDGQMTRGRLVMLSIVNIRTKSVVWGYGVTGVFDLNSAADLCAHAVKDQIRGKHRR